MDDVLREALVFDNSEQLLGPRISAGSAGAAPRCSDRSKPDCQPIALGLTDRPGVGLAVLGDSVYWARGLLDARVLAKTSIADGSTVDLAPTEPISHRTIPAT